MIHPKNDLSKKQSELRQQLFPISNVCLRSLLFLNFSWETATRAIERVPGGLIEDADFLQEQRVGRKEVF